jgi:hypothetical protein
VVFASGTTMQCSVPHVAHRQPSLLHSADVIRKPATEANTPRATAAVPDAIRVSRFTFDSPV